MSNDPSPFTGFTPVPDCIRESLGPIAAAVFGAVWRFGQMRNGECEASVLAIAERAGYGTTVTREALRSLVAEKWISESPRVGRPTTYRDSGRWTMRLIGEDTKPQREALPTPTRGVAVAAEPQRVALPTPTRGVAPTPTRGVAKDSTTFEDSFKTQVNGLTPTSKDDVGGTGANDAPVGATGDARSTGPAGDPPLRRPAKRASKRQPADRVPLGPGSEIYRDVFHLTPNIAQRQLLDEAHATLGASDLRFYLTRWLAHGWSPKNVPGMVDFALARGQSKPPVVVGSSLNGQSPPTNGNRGPVTVIPGVRL